MAARMAWTRRHRFAVAAVCFAVIAVYISFIEDRSCSLCAVYPFPDLRLELRPLALHCPQPLVSVVLITKDNFEPLQNAIDAILHQTYPNVEVVVVDDASEDPRYLTLESGRDRNRFRVLRSTGSGGVLGVVRNMGIREARGSLVAFTDDDDVFLPTKLEEQVNTLCRYANTSVAMSATEAYALDVPRWSTNEETGARSFTAIDPTAPPAGLRLYMKEERGYTAAELPPGLWGWQVFGSGNNPVVGPSVLVRRDVFIIGGGFNLCPMSLYCEDLVYWHNALQNGFRIHFDPTPSMLYDIL